MKFLDELITGSDGSSYQGEWYRDNWELIWEAEDSLCEIEDDEGDVIEERMQYIFSRVKNFTEGAAEWFDTDLSDYLGTQTLMKYIWKDIHFLSDECLAAEEEKGRYKAMFVGLCPRQVDCLQHFQKMEEQVNSIYRQIFENCAKRHRCTGSMYCLGLLYFQQGDFLQAFDTVSSCIKENKKQRKGSESPVEVHYYQGILAAEIGAYNDAVEHLSLVIERNPKHSEAYFERAAAYFELGQFDLSLQDYLDKGRGAIPLAPMVQTGSYDFGLGIVMGAGRGAVEASSEFIPSICSSVRGLGHLVWATIRHPIAVPQQFILATTEFCRFLRACDKKELVRILVPEMYELITAWDVLSQKERGEQMGYVLGKYGTDVLLPIAAFKGVAYVRAYHEIRKAEKLCVLETLAQSAEHKEALMQGALKWNEQRAAYFSNVKLVKDQQAKHILGSWNYMAEKSRWSHGDPEGLLKKFAGKGQKIAGEPCTPGYRERVDFQEVIGYFLERETGIEKPTTMGVIHYSKEGAHIVPAKPK